MTTPPTSSFYVNGTIYQALATSDAVVANMNSLASQAQTSANNAATSATNAASSATSASSSASSAATAVQNAAGVVTPAVNGTAAVGTSTKWSHEDHVHPTDTTRAPIASPTFTGVPAAPTPVSTDNSTTVATTAFVQTAVNTSKVASLGGVTGAIAVGPNLQMNGSTLQDSTALIGEVRWMSTTRAPANFVRADGSLASRTTFAALFAALVFSATVSFTNGTTAFTWNAHGMSAGDKVKLYGSVPTGFTAGTSGYNVGTEYYVITTGLTTNAFQLSATPGGAAITPGSTGTCTAVNAPWGDGDGSTTFNLPKLLGDFIRCWDGGAGIDTNRAFGAEQLDQMQGHYHSNTLAVTATKFSGDFSLNSTGGTNQYGPSGGNSATIAGGVTTPSTDGTNGTPRTGAETRPRNHVLLPVIRYQ